jgi:hypothetical protein
MAIVGEMQNSKAISTMGFLGDSIVIGFVDGMLVKYENNAASCYH